MIFECFDRDTDSRGRIATDRPKPVGVLDEIGTQECFADRSYVLRTEIVRGPNSPPMSRGSRQPMNQRERDISVRLLIAVNNAFMGRAHAFPQT